MIKTINLQKIFKTEEVQTLALNDVIFWDCWTIRQEESII